jgi:hypothetical protein
MYLPNRGGRLSGEPIGDRGATGTAPARPVPQTETEATHQPASLQAAAGVTAFVGLVATVMGGAHLQGVIGNSLRRGYAYDLRLEALLVLGFGIVFAGVLCLSAVRGLARGQRRAWDRALIGSVLLILVTGPIMPHPHQGVMAVGLSLSAVVNLIALAAAWRRLEAG